MNPRKTKAGVAVALSLSLALSGTHTVSAHAQPASPAVSNIASPYATPQLNLSNPIYIDGQNVVILGNRYSLVEAGAVAAQLAIGGALAVAALISRSKGCGSSEVSTAELSSCLGEGVAQDSELLGSASELVPERKPTPVTVKTSPEYKNGKSLSQLRVGKDDMDGFGPFVLEGKTYADSLVTTGNFSGWGTRYFEFSGENVDGFGAVVGIQDQGNGRSGSVPAKAVLVVRADGTTVEQVEIVPGKPQYVEHKFAKRAQNINVEIIGYEADGAQMNMHGGFVIGSPRVW